jgi:SAM-dependent methyltransferase
MEEPSVRDAWDEGGAYDCYMGRWSSRVAPLFLSWLALNAGGRRWLDVGCGTGALCAEIVRHADPAALTGVEPSAAFLAVARQRLPASTRLLMGDARAIPLPDGEADVVVSGLVLNFIPDLPRGLTEMGRVAAPGGLVAGYVWDYADGMEMLRCFWDTASELDARAGTLHEGRRFPLCRPQPLRSAFEQAGFTRVEVAPLEVQMWFARFEELWESFLGAQGPAPAYVASLSEEHRRHLRDALRERFPAADDGSLVLRARAWAVRGSTP